MKIMFKTILHTVFIFHQNVIKKFLYYAQCNIIVIVIISEWFILNNSFRKYFANNCSLISESVINYKDKP